MFLSLLRYAKNKNGWDKPIYDEFIEFLVSKRVLKNSRKKEQYIIKKKKKIGKSYF